MVHYMQQYTFRFTKVMFLSRQSLPLPVISPLQYCYIPRSCGGNSTIIFIQTLSSNFHSMYVLLGWQLISWGGCCSISTASILQKSYCPNKQDLYDSLKFNHKFVTPTNYKTWCMHIIHSDWAYKIYWFC